MRSRSVDGGTWFLFDAILCVSGAAEGDRADFELVRDLLSEDPYPTLETIVPRMNDESSGVDLALVKVARVMTSLFLR